MKPLLSIIVPAYNAEKWIEFCLRSILRVSVPYPGALEVIVVNDGSTDGTSEVLERFQVSESFREFQVSEGFKFQVIQQENRGLSGARNTGMRVATGRYIAFVDADDEWCEKCTIPWSLLQEEKIELIGLEMVRLSANGKRSAYRRYKSDYNKCYAPALSFLKNRNLFPSACANLYKKSLIEREDLYFTEGIYHEDEEFTTRAFLKAQNFVAVPGPHYLYIERSNSITTNQDPEKLKKRMTDLLFILKRLQSFSTPEQKGALRCKICFLTTDTIRVLLANTQDKHLIVSVLNQLNGLHLFPFPFFPNLHYLLVCIYLYGRLHFATHKSSK